MSVNVLVIFCQDICVCVMDFLYIYYTTVQNIGVGMIF